MKREREPLGAGNGNVERDGKEMRGILERDKYNWVGHTEPGAG